MSAVIRDDDVGRFEHEGYLVLDRAVSADTLGMLRREADEAIAWEERRIAAADSGVETISRLGERYFVPGRSREQEVMRDFLFGEVMLEIARRLLGPDAYLFTELFVCKMRDERTEFGWHQDFGYLASYGFGHYQPNLSVWTALDDMSEENGALTVLPFSEWGSRRLVEHRLDPETRDQVADFGDHAGRLLVIPAGSIVVLSGLVPHKSGRNGSGRPRRAHLVQYSREPVLAGGRPIQFAVPALVAGEPQRPRYDATTLR
jgi:ectoine hydroxylase-related dioxygenase (phytanoyl-CoA dioxygenase family)